MTVIRPNSVSGINSITAQADEIKVFKSDGTQGGLIIGGANLNTTSGISTLLALNVTGNVSIAGTLTYQDVTNVDSVGIITARSTIDAQGDVSIADKIIHTGDTNTALRFPAADTFSVETAGSEVFRLTSDRKVGINRTSPARHLHAYAPGAGFVAKFEGAFSYSAVEFADNGTTNAPYIGSKNDDFTIATGGNNERLRITSAGNVGIGTDNPQVKLTVSSTSPAVCDIHHIDGGTNDEARIILGALAGNPPSNRGAGIAAVNNGAGHDLIIKCSASHGAGPGEKVRITSGGLVGIASDSPTVALDVVGDTHLGSKKFVFNGTSGHFGIYDSSTDTTPNNDIEVVSSAPQIRLEENSSGASKRLDLFVTSSGQPTIAANQSSQSIAFQTTNSERFRITNDGVTFNGDTAAANALDDYETGTFVPTFLRASSNPSASFYTQLGRYTKIGNLVHVQLMIDAYNVSGGSGQWQVGNFPYATENADVGYNNPMCNARIYLDGDYAMGTDGATLRATYNTTTWVLFNQDDDTSVTGNFSRIIFQGSITYRTNP